MIRVALCKSCGSAYDEDEISDGYCLDCPSEADTEIQELVEKIKKEHEE